MNSLKEFGVFLAEEERSQATIEKYLRDAGKFLRWLEGRELNKQAVLSFKLSLQEEYKITSANSILSAVNSFLTFIGHPECRVKTFKTQREAFRAEEKELTRTEYERLLAASRDDPRLNLLMQTICATGIRVSEHPFITVEAAEAGKAAVRCKGKSRIVWIPKKLCRALLRYARERRIRSGSIFVTKSGKPLDRSRVWAEMKKLCRTARVSAEKVFPHNLRHLFARIYYSVEKDIVRLADILGHASVNTTRIYTRESGEVHRRQIEKLPLLHIT